MSLHYFLWFQGSRVEVKQDNRYVVPTFALVGTIAAVVLTVVGIYLCKRHSRSKKKLAQLATNGDGNEASKDYQVKLSCMKPTLKCQ